MQTKSSKSKTATRTCEYCRNDFKIPEWRIRAGRGRWCSIKCSCLARRLPLRERFLSKIVVDDKGCWIWTGAVSGNGYGNIALPTGTLRVRPIPAHHASWIIHIGEVPDGMFVLHKCDVRRCVNPTHLFIGTQSDNMVDMVSKGRHKGFAKLNKWQVRIIKAMANSRDMTQREIGNVFGVGQTTVSAIHVGDNWRHICSSPTSADRNV